MDPWGYCRTTFLPSVVGELTRCNSTFDNTRGRNKIFRRAYESDWFLSLLNILWHFTTFAVALMGQFCTSSRRKGSSLAAA
jgi:hypothetical protein